MARSLKRIALIVSIGTLASKSAGLIRQLVIAAAFGIGAAYDAYNYAYVLPGFLLILLGGINGPFHTAMVSALSRRSTEDKAHVIAVINTLVSILLCIVTLILIIYADSLISLVGPGLSPEVHRIATVQLQVMAPIALLAGLIGLGFGYLNASDEFFVPAISPLISSLSIIVGVGVFWIKVGPDIESIDLALQGGIVLAGATLVGALLQWLIQLPSLIRKGLSKFQLSWDWRDPGVKEVLSVMGPATLSSGMLQINVFTDLFFASGIVGAAAGLGYANLIVQTPLGLISSALLVPLLPTFARLTNPQDRQELIDRIRQGLMLSTTCMIPLGALFATIGGPIVHLIYQRGAFDSEASVLVTGLLLAYGIGMPWYLGRDLLVRVFYALGDGITPMRFSTAGIVLNVVFDWFLVGGPTPWGPQLPFNFGAAGLVLATVAINMLTCICLLMKLHIKLKGIPLKQWATDAGKLLLSGIIAGLVALSLGKFVAWPIGTLGLVVEVSLCSLTAIGFFAVISNSLGISEVHEIWLICRKQLTHD